MEHGDYERVRVERDFENARRAMVVVALGAADMAVWEDEDGETIVRGLE